MGEHQQVNRALCDEEKNYFSAVYPCSPSVCLCTLKAVQCIVTSPLTSPVSDLMKVNEAAVNVNQKHSIQKATSHNQLTLTHEAHNLATGAEMGASLSGQRSFFYFNKEENSTFVFLTFRSGFTIGTFMLFYILCCSFIIPSHKHTRATLSDVDTIHFAKRFSLSMARRCR